MNLVIVESPTKARTLSKYLGNGYQVEASMGHLRDLPKSKMGIDVEHDFRPDYIEVKGKGQVIKTLQSAAAKAAAIYLAMDPDREGEAIAWHVERLLRARSNVKRQTSKHFKRVTFHEITKDAILRAMEESHELNLQLVDAQQARRVVDRLVGYTLSPVLWKKVRRGLSAGRVQSVALRLIVEREREIEGFRPKEYWEIRVLLTTGKGPSTAQNRTGSGRAQDDKRDLESLSRLSSEELFWVELVAIDGKQAKRGEFLVTRGEEAKHLVNDLKRALYTVLSIERKEQRRSPYPPFTTSTLQQAAANVLGWTAKQTMRVAQQLYEQGRITYHRTDSVHLAEFAIQATRSLIEKKFGSAYLPAAARRYKTKSKNAQEAHEAIRPTDVNSEFRVQNSEVDPRAAKLYELIWKRMVASQMSEAVFDATTIEVMAMSKHRAPNSKGYTLRASGSILKFEGWKKVYGNKILRRSGPSQEARSAQDDNAGLKSVPALSSESVVLPEVSSGEELLFKDITSEQKFTQPPARYNDASLVKALEKRGIGRPSTYAPIISTIIDRGYVERVEKRFQPTVIGMAVTDFLLVNFADVMDYDFTAEMEEDLDRIARGEKEWVPVVRSFWDPFEKKVVMVEEKAKRVAIPVEKTGKQCPECRQGEVVIRTGRFGKFYSCSRFPECKYTETYRETVEGLTCPKCSTGDVVVKRTKRGRQFYGCSRYPECDWASWQDPRKGERA